MPETERLRILQQITLLITSIQYQHPLRIAIDGIDAAGKSSLAAELALLIKQAGRPCIQASIDDFQHPRAIRYQQGALSADSYYWDSFDYQALLQQLLLPLGPDGNWQYRTQTFDYERDQPVDLPLQQATKQNILLVDGVFLLRPEIVSYWDLRIFVAIPFELALERALQRDLALFGSKIVITQRYQQRYLPAQRIYYTNVQPETIADLVIDNSQPATPVMYMRNRYNQSNHDPSRTKSFYPNF